MAAVLLVAAQAQIAQAATISVTTTNDELNSDGDCALREAIQTANTDMGVEGCVVGAGADTVELASGTYTLTIPGDGEDANASGDLDVASDLTIAGAGAGSSTVNGAQLDRVLDIAGADATAAISALTIRGGMRPFVTEPTPDREGAGIRSRGATLSLDGVTVTANSVAGVEGGSIYSNGVLTIDGSTVTGNTGISLGGAGVHSQASGGAATLHINDSTVVGNSLADIVNTGDAGPALANVDDSSSGRVSNRGQLAALVVQRSTATTFGNGGSGYVTDSAIGGETVSSVIGNGGTLELDNTTIANGVYGGIANGGFMTLEGSTVSGNAHHGIQNDSGGVLTLNYSTVSGNDAGDLTGGGILNSGEATLNHSTVADNFSSGVAGGIFNLGTLTLNNSTLSRNRAALYAGAIESAGTLVLNGATVSGNSAPASAGVLVTSGNASFTGSAITGNTANGAGNGGGIAVVNASVSLMNTTVSANTASNGNGGGIYQAQGSLSIEDSTVSGNVARDPGGAGVDFGEGAGLWIQKDATMDVLDSTISANTSDTNGGGIWSAGTLALEASTVSANVGRNGGGLHNHGGTLDLTNTTVTGNSATQGGGILDHDVAGGPSGGTTLQSSTIAQNAATSTGGGLKNLQASPPSGPYGKIALKDTIVANNEVNQTPSECAGPITSGIEGFSGAYNLIEMIDSTPPQECTISGDTAGNITGQDPKLGLLADNTGPTKTHMLALGSPALNQGSSSCPTQDQRGTSRPQDFACDIGAVERDPLVDLDADHDGCADDRETDTNAAQGGLRDPSNFWDFMDVPTGTGFARDKRVSGGDIAAVVARFGSNDSKPGQFNKQSDPLSTPNATILPSGARANYHPAYDRGGTIVGGDRWDLKPADGSIAGGDISATVAQFGHNCVA
ncbi:MAG: flexitail domain-containing putative surface protein [Solirubrobacterales bacterium]